MSSQKVNISRSEPPAFACGSVVLVTLSTPREKFWGVVLEVSPAGLSLRGMDLTCFDDFTSLAGAGEASALNAVFFPMHRVERMEADARSGEIPSLRERFEARSGHSLSDFMPDELRSLLRP